MKNTNIEWTDHTLNFWWGCDKVSPACTHCYAETVAKVFGKRLFGQVPEWGQGKPRFERLEAARKEALALNRQAQKAAEKWERETAELITRGSASPTPKPTRPRVFVNSMSDWLDEEVPIAWLAYLLETLHLCPHLDFQLLTKRPENWKSRITACYMEHAQGSMDFDNWLFDWTGQDKTETLNRIAPAPPPNVWLGTTVESQEWANKRLPHLLKIPAKIRFLSCEPLLGPIDLLHIPKPLGPRYLGQKEERAEFYPVLASRKTTANNGQPPQTTANGSGPGIHWVIAGGESGSKARPTHPDWIRSLRDQCASACVPFHFKQWGEWLPISQTVSADASYDPDNPRKRYRGHTFDDGTLLLRIGTDHTGRHLDGHLHDAFPPVLQASSPVSAS